MISPLQNWFSQNQKFSVAKISVRHYFWIHFLQSSTSCFDVLFKYCPLLFSKASFTLVELCWEPSTWVLPHSCSHLSWETSCHTETLTQHDGHQGQANHILHLTCKCSLFIQRVFTTAQPFLTWRLKSEGKIVERDVMLERTYCRHSLNHQHAT